MSRQRNKNRLTNDLDSGEEEKDFSDFLKILSPLAPHLAEELWANAGLKGMCCSQKWPKFDRKLVEEKNILLIVQINGKVRDKIEASIEETNVEEEKEDKLMEELEEVLDRSKGKNFVREVEDIVVEDKGNKLEDRESEVKDNGIEEVPKEDKEIENKDNFEEDDFNSSKLGVYKPEEVAEDKKEDENKYKYDFDDF